MKTAAIIVAGGRGHRIGSDLPKQFQPIAGKPLLYYTLSKFEAASSVEDVLLVVAREWLYYASQDVVDRYGFNKIRKIVAGGQERQDSVYEGLKALEEDTEYVLIHDAVRPFVSVEKIDEIAAAVREHEAAVLAVPPSDTVKMVRQGRVEKTLPRKSLWLVQTPQAFAAELIQRVYRQAMAEGFYATDDAALVERQGHPVVVVAGEPQNIKITRPVDLQIAEQWLKAE